MEFKDLNRIIGKIELNSKIDTLKTLKVNLDKNRKKVSVLGFDIYHYSQYESPAQDIIPFIFEAILRDSSQFASTYDSYIYQKYTTEIYEKLISTGDGGFIIFDNPLEALIFLLYFNLNLKYFNSFHKIKRIREFVGPISIRFSITYDFILEYENNIFGPAIINNARIMSGDKLNRLLIDKNTHDWFEQNIFGLENLPNISIDTLKEKGLYTSHNDPIKNSWYINNNVSESIEPRISTVDVLKLGESEIKKNKLDTYNVIVTYTAKVFKEIEIKETDTFSLISLNLGNYNTSGL